MKGMLLAAGMGERLAPITHVIPKPLIPVLGRPIAPQVLSRLAAEGVEEVVINLHHLPDRIRAAFGDGSSFGLRALHYSLEDDRLLGTGGGLARAASTLRGDGTILVRNSDFLADIPLAAVVASHLRSRCPATLVLAPHRGRYTRVKVEGARRVVAFGEGDYLFTGYHLIEEEVLDLIPGPGPSDIVREVYFEMAAAGKLNAYVHEGSWWEFGTPEEYLDGSEGLIGLAAEKRARLGNFDVVRLVGQSIAAIGPGVDLDAESVHLAGSVALGLGAMIGEGATIRDTVVMPEAWIGPRSKLRRCIVGPGAEIPAGFQSTETVITGDPDPNRAVSGAVERIDGLLLRRFSNTQSR